MSERTKQDGGHCIVAPAFPESATTHAEERGVEVQHRPAHVAHPLLVDYQSQPRADLVVVRDVFPCGFVRSFVRHGEVGGGKEMGRVVTEEQVI